MQNKLESLSPETFYHIYNRANGNELLFYNSHNYHFFLNKFKLHIAPICHVYCYCLMPNHFHFLIKIKSEEELQNYFGNVKSKAEQDLNFVKFITNENLSPTFPKFQTSKKILFDGDKDNLNLPGFENLAGLVSQQFSNFFNSYSKSINKQETRKGSLFVKPFKRKKITDQKYLLNLIQYIHLNPFSAGLCSKVNDWKYSSYNAICSQNNSLVEKKIVIEWFDSIENFIFIHSQKPKSFEIEFD